MRKPWRHPQVPKPEELRSQPKTRPEAVQTQHTNPGTHRAGDDETEVDESEAGGRVPSLPPLVAEVGGHTRI